MFSKRNEEMENPIIYLEWDSDFFKLKVGKCNFNEFDDLNLIKKEAKNESYNLVYLFSKKPIENINDVSYKSIDYEKDLLLSHNIIFHNIQAFRGNELKDDLLELAIESGKFSRFKLDEKFPKNSFSNLYSLWIERSVKKEIADEVLVYIENKHILGMITYKLNDHICRIGLIAVSSLSANKGIGSLLIKYLENKMLLIGISKIRVSTQFENSVACHFYERNGYKMFENLNVYHLWL